MIWQTLLFAAIGFFVSTVFLTEVLRILTCGYPITNKLYKQGIISDKKHINLRNTIRLVINILIIAIIVFCIVYFVNVPSNLGFFSGILIAVLVGLKRLGYKDTNLCDYIHANNLYINIENYKKTDDEVINRLIELKKIMN